MLENTQNPNNNTGKDPAEEIAELRDKLSAAILLGQKKSEEIMRLEAKVKDCLDMIDGLMRINTTDYHKTF